MKRNYVISILAIALMISGSIFNPTTTVKAQSTRKIRGWGAFRPQSHQEQNPVRHQSEIQEAAFTERGETAQQAETGKSLIVGTWYIEVPGLGGEPGFQAYHTFSEDGTFVETSSLLGMLPEGPAHGVWSGKKRDYLLTFELFAFDPDGNAAGRIRVRCAIHITDDDHLTANTKVDFIEPDGNVIPEIASGPFTGTRVKVQPF